MIAQRNVAVKPEKPSLKLLLSLCFYRYTHGKRVGYMKKNYFIALFIGVHVIFIVFQIDKQSRLVRLSYEKQKLETEKAELKARKQLLANNFHEIKSPSRIKEFAIKNLAMKPVTISQVKRIPSSC